MLAEREKKRKWKILSYLFELRTDYLRGVTQYLTKADGRKQARQQDSDLANYIRIEIMDCDSWDD